MAGKLNTRENLAKGLMKMAATRVAAIVEIRHWCEKPNKPALSASIN
jgi:hypothetical protein